MRLNARSLNLLTAPATAYKGKESCPVPLLQWAPSQEHFAKRARVKKIKIKGSWYTTEMNSKTKDILEELNIDIPKEIGKFGLDQQKQ